MRGELWPEVVLDANYETFSVIQWNERQGALAFIDLLARIESHRFPRSRRFVTGFNDFHRLDRLGSGQGGRTIVAQCVQKILNVAQVIGRIDGHWVGRAAAMSCVHLELGDTL